MLNEINQAVRDKYYLFWLLCGSKRSDPIELENRIALPRCCSGQEREGGERLVNLYKDWRNKSWCAIIQNDDFVNNILSYKSK
jgi:hypothetical protein